MNLLKVFSTRTAVVIAIAVAMFAVVGYAASFAINPSPNVNAEGETLVVSCTERVKVVKIDGWRDPVAGLPGDGGFYVEQLAIDTEGDCNGDWAYIVLTGNVGQALATFEVQLDAAGAVQFVDTAAADIRVQDLHDIHVLVSGARQKQLVGP